MTGSNPLTRCGRLLSHKRRRGRCLCKHLFTATRGSGFCSHSIFLLLSFFLCLPLTAELLFSSVCFSLFFLLFSFLRSDTFVSGTLPSPYRTTFIFPLIFSALSTNSNHFQTVIFVHFFSLTKLTQANNFNCQHLRPLQLLAGLDLMHHYQHHNAHLFGYNIFCVVSLSAKHSIL